jgi:hypothetical protein
VVTLAPWATTSCSSRAIWTRCSLSSHSHGLYTNPVALGQGLSIFPHDADDTPLRLKTVDAFTPASSSAPTPLSGSCSASAVRDAHIDSTHRDHRRETAFVRGVGLHIRACPTRIGQTDLAATGCLLFRGGEPGAGAASG